MSIGVQRSDIALRVGHWGSLLARVSHASWRHRLFHRYPPGLLRPPRPGNAQGTQLDVILRSTGTLSGLVEDLLLLGKVEAGKLACQPVSLDLPTLCRHLTDEVLSATQHACPIELLWVGARKGECRDQHHPGRDRVHIKKHMQNIFDKLGG
jgi:signal transduction histidine kinase